MVDHKEHKERKEGNLEEDGLHPPGDRTLLPSDLHSALVTTADDNVVSHRITLDYSLPWVAALNLVAPPTTGRRRLVPSRSKLNSVPSFGLRVSGFGFGTSPPVNYENGVSSH